MKLLFASLLIPFASFAAEPLVTCNFADLKSCKDCSKSLPVSCEDNSIQGALDLNLKPAKIQWKVINAKAGVEKIFMIENKNLTLKEITKANDFNALAKKQKITVAVGEVAMITGIQMNSGTALFKAPGSKEVIAKLKAQNPQRAVASAVQETRVGGVGRSQKALEKK